MTQKTLARAFVLISSIGFATQALAFTHSKFVGSDSNQGGAQNLEATVEQQDKLMQRYIKAQKEIFTAQKFLLEAFGKKEDAAKVDAVIQAWSSGAITQDQIERATELASSTQSEIDENIANEEQLTAEGRKKYQKSLLPYVNGLLQTTQLAPEFKSLLISAQAEIKSAPLTKKLEVKERLGTGVYVATKLPGHIGRLTSATQKVLTYARSQNLDTASAGEIMNQVPDLPASGAPGTAGLAAPANSAAASTSPAKRSTQQAVQPVAQPSAHPAATARRAEFAPATDRAFRVQLASSRSERGIWRDWSVYQTRYADIFGGLDARVERAEIGAERAVWYRLQVGPFASRSSALELCAKIAARGVGTGCLPLRVSL